MAIIFPFKTFFYDPPRRLAHFSRPSSRISSNLTPHPPTFAPARTIRRFSTVRAKNSRPRLFRPTRPTLSRRSSRNRGVAMPFECQDQGLRHRSGVIVEGLRREIRCVVPVFPLGEQCGMGWTGSSRPRVGQCHGACTSSSAVLMGKRWAERSLL